MRIALLITLLALVPALAGAQRDMSPQERIEAEAAFKQGEAYYHEGLYEKAIESYRKSYQLSGLSELFINIAQAQRLADKTEEALATYETFLAENPTHRYSDEVRQWIATLTKQLDDQRKRASIDEAREQQQNDAAPAPAMTPASNTADVEARGGRSGSKLLRYSGISAGAVGLLSIGLGIKYGFDARNIEEELSDNAEPWTEALLDRIDDGERAERNSIIFLSVGGGAVVAGAVLYFLGLPGSENQVAVSPTSSGGLALSLGGRF